MITMLNIKNKKEKDMRKIKIKIKGTNQIVVAFKNKVEIKRIVKMMVSKMPKDLQEIANSKMGETKFTEIDFATSSIWNLGKDFSIWNSIKFGFLPNVEFKPFKKPRPLVLPTFKMKESRCN